MVDCIVKRSDLKAKTAFFVEFLSGNERTFEKETGELAKKMPHRLKELLKLTEMTHA